MLDCRRIWYSIHYFAYTALKKNDFLSFGVIGNCGSLKTFYYRTVRMLFKWLNRRSQRLSYNWAGFKDLLNQFLIPAPKITEKYPSKQLKLFV